MKEGPKHLPFARIQHRTYLEGGRPSFHLYAIGEDGQGFERLTFDGQFNSFPMFSPDGTSLVWVSDRQAKVPGEFNVFLADWVP